MEAMQVVETVRGSRMFQWCLEHRWRVLFGVALLMFLRHWLADGSAGTKERAA
jgi:hypothetical protein